MEQKEPQQEATQAARCPASRALLVLLVRPSVVQASCPASQRLTEMGAQTQGGALFFQPAGTPVLGADGGDQASGYCTF